MVFRCVRIVLFGTWFGTEEALVLTLRIFSTALITWVQGSGATRISAMEGRAHRRRAKAPFSRPAAHQGANLMEEAQPPKENVEPKRFSWLECEPLPLPQLREGRGAVPSRGDVIEVEDRRCEWSDSGKSDAGSARSGARARGGNFRESGLLGGRRPGARKLCRSGPWYEEGAEGVRGSPLYASGT